MWVPSPAVIFCAMVNVMSEFITGEREIRRAMRPTWTRWLAVACLMYTATGAVLCPALAADELATQRDRFLQIAHSKWSGVHRWLLEYESTPGLAAVSRAKVHKTVAMAATDCFYHRAAYADGYPWESDPLCQEYIVRGGTTFMHWPFSRSYTEGEQKTGAPLGGSMGRDLAFAFVPIWPLTDYTSPVDPRFNYSVVPSEALQAPDCWLSPASPTIAGEKCVVFECSPADRIWLAAERPLCVMRREISDARTGRLVQRIETRQIRQVTPELWIPSALVVEYYDRGALEAVKVAEDFIEVVRFEINDQVPDSLFTPVFLSGTIRFDRGQEFKQISPGGGQVLSDVARFSVRYGRLPSEPAPAKWPLATYALALLIGSVTGLVVFYGAMVVRSRRVSLP